MSQHTRQGTTPQTIPSGGAPAPERTDAPDGRRLGLTLGTLVLPMYVALGAPSVALPTIGRALAVPFGATAWILAAWSLTSALAMPVAGRLLVRWSPFQVLVAGVVALAAGSALAGAGPTLSVVIVGRLIGGAGAGATVIAVFAAATALPGRQRIRALGIIAAASATASGCGTLSRSCRRGSHRGPAAWRNSRTTWPGDMACAARSSWSQAATTGQSPRTRTHAAAAALQTAVGTTTTAWSRSSSTSPAIARIDPGPETPAPTSAPDADQADDFLDDVGDAFRLGVLIVAAAIALPFLVGALLLVARARRRRAQAAEVRESGERSADEELVGLGDEIRELDLDTSMPNASRAALAEYEQAIARYDQANDLLSGDPTEYRVEQARAAIAAGRRHLAATRERLG